MRIKINPDSGLAPYMQIMKQVKYLVACGALKAGDQLPPVRDMAMQLRINPNTVARAYRELRYDKIITSKWGGGTFISEEVKQIADSEKKKIIAEILEQAIHQATSLGLTKEEITQLFTSQLKKEKSSPSHIVIPADIKQGSREEKEQNRKPLTIEEHQGRVRGKGDKQQ